MRCASLLSDPLKSQLPRQPARPTTNGVSNHGADQLHEGSGTRPPQLLPTASSTCDQLQLLPSQLQQLPCQLQLLPCLALRGAESALSPPAPT